MSLVMGVHSSSSATTIEVRDGDDGTVVASGRAAHPATRPPRCEQDPGRWWNALIAAVADSGIRQVAAMSVAAQPRGLVALDAAGAVLRPAKLWDDTESVADVAGLVDRVGPERWANACGSVPDAGFTIAQLAWLARVEPGVYRRLGKVLAPHDLLTYRLTGRFVTDRGDASGTGYWSPRDGRWHPELLDRAVGAHANGSWAVMLPEILGPDDPSDWVKASQNHHLGLRGRPLCGPGTGSPMAAALGVGLAPGDVLLLVGDHGTVSTVSPHPTADPTGAVLGLADATGRFLPTAMTGEAAHALDAVARIVGVDAAGLDALALRADPGAGGVVLLSGSLRNLGRTVTREQVARAAVEGVVCRLLDGVDALGAAGAATDGNVVLAGRAATSACGRVLADLSGRAVTVVGGDPAAAGAGAQAAAVLTGTPAATLADAWQLGRGTLVEPRSGVDRLAIRAQHAAARSR